MVSHVAATGDGNQSNRCMSMERRKRQRIPGFALDYDTTPLFIGTTGTWSPYLNMFLAALS